MRRLAPVLIVAVAVAVACAAVFATGASRAATWDLPSPFPEDDFRTRSAQAYAEAVGRASDGQLTLVVFAGGKLVAPDQTDQALRGNRVPIAVIELARLGDGASVFGFSALPFLAASYARSLALWNAARPVVRRRAADLGLMILYALPAPPAALFSRQPVTTVADLKGAPLIAADPWLRRLAADIGATPVDAATADVARLFAAGAAAAPPPRAAMLASFGDALRLSLWRLAGHAYDVQASFPLTVVAVNQEAFYALDEGSQRALLNAAVEAQNAAWSDSVDERGARIASLGDQELIVQPPPPGLRDGLVQAAAPLAAEWAAAAGTDGEAILAAFAAAGE